MVKIEDNTITITRGDTLEAAVTIKLEDGTDYVPAEGDVIRFALKSAYSDDTPKFIKTIPNDTMILRLEAEETKQLKARTRPYVYDMELTTPGGTVYTFIAQGKFYVTEEVY